MTPSQRFFPRILRLVAEVYEVSVDDLTAEENWLPENIREARRVVCLVSVGVVGMSTRQLGKLLQRDPHAIAFGIRKGRTEAARNPILSQTIKQIERRVREDVSAFEVFPEAAE